MNEINSFTFFRDYFNLIDTLPGKDKRELLESILDYMFKDIEPVLKGHNQAVFNTLKHQLDVSKNNSKRSYGNGAPIGNKNAAKKQTKNKPKTNQKQTEGITENKQIYISYFLFLISNFNNINNNTKLINKLEEWFKYKQEKKHKYTETGLKSLLKKVNDNVEKYGTEKVIELIDESMANNYQGIIWEKLNQTKGQKLNAFDKIRNLE